MRNHHQPIVVNNTEYSSIADAAKKLHVPLSTALTRLRGGASPEEAFKPEEEEPPHHETHHQVGGQRRTYQPNEVMTQKKGPVVAYKLDGHLFHDATSLAAAYHADPKMVQKRLDAGWSVAQSVGVAPQPRNAHQLHLCDNSVSLVVDGVSYGSTQELAHTLHLDLKLLVANLHAGTPVQEVVNTLRAGAAGLSHKDQVATKHDELPQTEQASTPAQTSTTVETGVVVQGQSFASEAAAARALGVARSTFYKRRAKGMSLLESLGIATDPKPKKEKKQKAQKKAQLRNQPAGGTHQPASPSQGMVARGSYPSERAAAIAFGIPLSTFYKHRAKGMTLDAIIATRASAAAPLTSGTAEETVTATATESPSTTPTTLAASGTDSATILVHGITYGSERAAAKANGIPPSTFYKRKKQGLSLFDMLGLTTAAQAAPSLPPGEPQPDAATTAVSVEGKQYSSARAAAKAYGVPLSTFYKKRKQGYSLAAILKIDGSLVTEAANSTATVPAPVHTPSSDASPATVTGVVVQGKTYPSERAAAKAHGVPLSTFYKKKNRGEELLSILGLAPLPSAAEIPSEPVSGIVVNGQSYPSERAAAKAQGVPLSTFYKKRKAGISLLTIIAQASTSAPAAVASSPRVTPLSLLSKPIMCNGVSYPSHRALAKAFNLSPHSLRYRLDTLHLSAEAAVGITPEKSDAAITAKSGQHNAKPVMFRGVSYPSFRKLAEAFGIEPRKAHQRVARGWTLDKALEAPAEIPPATTMKAVHDAGTERKEVPLPDSVYFQGTHYPSVSAFAQAYNQPAELVAQRLRDGWSRAESVGLVGHSDEHDEHKRMTDHFLVEGRSFKSVRVLAEHYRIKDHVLRYRLQSGWTVNQAVGLEPAPELGAEGFHDEGLKAFPVLLNQVSYPSVTALAQAYQLSPRLIRQRLKHGWSVRAAVGLPEEDKTMGELRVGELTFKSVRALASHFHISEAKVRYRLKVGWTAAQSVEQSPSPNDLAKQGKGTRNISDMLPITLGGNTFHTAAAFARHYGQNVAKVSGRLRNGWTPEESVGLAKHRRESITHSKTEQIPSSTAKFMIGTKRFHSARELAAAYKLSYRVVQYRLAKGATPAQAVGVEPWSSTTEKSGDPVMFDGKTYPNYLALCKALSLNYNMFMSRLGRGWSVQRAVVTPSAHAAGMDALMSTAQSLRQTPADLRLGKKQYHSIESFAKEHALESTVVYDRLSKGWTPEQIVGQAPPPHWH